MPEYNGSDLHNDTCGCSQWSAMFCWSSLKDEKADCLDSINSLGKAIRDAELRLNSLRYQHNRATEHLAAIKRAQ